MRHYKVVYEQNKPVMNKRMQAQPVRAVIDLCIITPAGRADKVASSNSPSQIAHALMPLLQNFSSLGMPSRFAVAPVAMMMLCACTYTNTDKGPLTRATYASPFPDSAIISSMGGSVLLIYEDQMLQGQTDVKQKHATSHRATAYSFDKA